MGGERSGGQAGRGSENKMPFVATVSLDVEGHPLCATLTPAHGFTPRALATWANAHLRPGSTGLCDGLACFGGVIEAGCQHRPVVVGARKPRDLPDFHWVHTLLGDVKTRLSGAYRAFDFRKCAESYLGTIAYCYNRRFKLHAPRGTSGGRGGLWSAPGALASLG